MNEWLVIKIVEEDETFFVACHVLYTGPHEKVSDTMPERHARKLADKLNVTPSDATETLFTQAKRAGFPAAKLFAEHP